MQGVDVEGKIKTKQEKIRSLQKKVDELKRENTGLVSIVEIAKNLPPKKYFPTGWKRLDETTGGFCGGHLWVIAAYTNVGKSTFSLQTLCHVAHNGASVRLYSLEMTAGEISDRILQICKEKKYDFNTFKFDIITMKDSIEEISLDIQANQCDIVCIDYLQLLSSEKGEIEYQAITRISKIAQRMAITKNVCVIALSQVSNEGASTNSTEVMRMKGSGQIGASADKVLFIQKKAEEELDDSRQFVESKLTLRKNRQGRKVFFTLQFNTHTGLFESDPLF